MLRPDPESKKISSGGQPPKNGAAETECTFHPEDSPQSLVTLQVFVTPADPAAAPTMCRKDAPLGLPRMVIQAELIRHRLTMISLALRNLSPQECLLPYGLGR